MNLFEWQQTSMSQGPVPGHGQAQRQEVRSEPPAMSLGNSGKTEVDLFPALADRKALSVVAPRAACSGPQISLFEPTDYEDALDIVECLRSRAATTITLDKMSKSDANRLVDFIAGASAAIDGAFHKLSELVYFFAPSNVQIVVKDQLKPADAAFTAPPSFSSSAAAFSGSVAAFNSAPPSFNSPSPYSPPSHDAGKSLDSIYPEPRKKRIPDNVWTKLRH